MLYKPESSLEKEQLTLLDALLTQYPTIQIAYQLVQQFASRYHKRNIGKPLYIIKSEWHNDFFSEQVLKYTFFCNDSGIDSSFIFYIFFFLLS